MGNKNEKNKSTIQGFDITLILEFTKEYYKLHLACIFMTSRLIFSQNKLYWKAPNKDCSHM